MAYLTKRCGTFTPVDDLFQETFIAVYRNLKQYNSSLPFSAWIFGIARNKTNEHYRKIKSIHDIESPNSIEHTSPSSLLNQALTIDLFWNEAKRLLNEDQFTALWLRYQEEFAIKEISEAMNKSKSNIKVLLFRARKELANSKALANQQYSKCNHETHL